MQPEYSVSRSTTVLAPEQHRVLRNTYWLLALTLIPTAVGAAVGMNLDLSFMRANPVISLIAVLAIFYGWIYATATACSDWACCSASPASWACFSARS